MKTAEKQKHPMCLGGEPLASLAAICQGHNANYNRVDVLKVRTRYHWDESPN